MFGAVYSKKAVLSGVHCTLGPTLSPNSHLFVTAAPPTTTPTKKGEKFQGSPQILWIVMKRLLGSSNLQDLLWAPVRLQWLKRFCFVTCIASCLKEAERKVAPHYFIYVLNLNISVQAHSDESRMKDSRLLNSPNQRRARHVYLSLPVEVWC